MWCGRGTLNRKGNEVLATISVNHRPFYSHGLLLLFSGGSKMKN